MPISGLVVRFDRARDEDRAESLKLLEAIDGVELGQIEPHAVSAVIDAPDYAVHDAALDCIERTPSVCAIDVVFHDFSDVGEFEPTSRTQRSKKR